MRPPVPRTELVSPPAPDNASRVLPGLDRLDLPPPKDWQAFERLCQALWRRLWKTSNIVAHGRSGQKQHGVDLYGTPLNQPGVHGIQCKCVDQLTEAQLIAEVEKAKGFQPALSELIIATTAASDTQLLALTRRITEEHAARGLFPVRLLGWGDICSLMADHRDVAALAYPEWVTERPETRLDTTLLSGVHTTARATEMHADVLSHFRTLQESLQRFATPTDGPAHGKLDVIRDLLKDHDYQAALNQLERLRREEWDTTTDPIRFRAATNLGAAYMGLGQYDQAGHWFLRAFDFDPVSDKALSNRALGLLLLDRAPEARAAAEEARAQHPVSPLCWKAYLNVLNRYDPQAPLPEIPPELAQDPDVLLLRAEAVAGRGQWGEAERLLRQVIALPDFDVTAQARLADVILIQVTGGTIFGGVPYSASEMARIGEALALFDDTWRRLKASDRRASIQIVQNACAMRAALGQRHEAERFLDEALLLCPEEPTLLARKIRFAALRDDGTTAVRLLETLSPTAVADYPILAATAYRAAKDPLRGAQILEQYLTDLTGSDSAAPDSAEVCGEAACLLADFLVEADLPHAQARFDALTHLDPNARARATVIFARALRAASREEAAQGYLQNARPALESSPDPRDRLILADALAEFEDYPAALALYEKDIATGSDTTSLREYIRCLLELDQRRRLTEVMACLPEALARKAHYEWVAAAVHLRTGDYPAARAALERCLAIEPTNRATRLVWAELCIRGADPQPAQAWLDTVTPRDKTLSLEQLVQIGRLRHALGQPDLARATFYEALRRFPSEPRAHLGFHSAMLFKGEPEAPIDVPEVTPNTAVRLRDNSTGSEFTYILEDRPEDELLEHEIPLTSALGQRLLGRKPLETVPGHASELAVHDMSVLAIHPKYVYALQVSMNAFNTRFPDEQGLIRVQLPASEVLEERFAPILQALKDKAERVREIETLYTQGMPIALVATLLGHSSPQTWRGLAGRAGHPIRVCLGNVSERDRALELVRQPQPRFLLEPIALIELHLLEGLNAAKACGQLCLVQSTLEELRDQIQDLDLHPQGYRNTFEEGGQYLRHDVTAKDIATERARLQSLLVWARTHCTVIPAVPTVDPPPQFAAAAATRLGQAVYDTLLAAQGGGYVLISDDLHLRQLAQLQFGIQGVWIQPLLMHAAQTQQFAIKAYHHAVIQLALWRHDFTGVNADQLLFVARRDHWNVTPEFEALAATLPLSRSDFSANMAVCAKFLQALWHSRRRRRRRAGPRKVQARKLTHALLRGVDPGNSPHTERFFHVLVAVVQRGLLPPAAGEALRDWYRQQRLAPLSAP